MNFTLSNPAETLKSVSSFLKRTLDGSALPDTEADTLAEGKKLLAYYNANRPYGPQQYICSAPFKSLYFESQGRAVACCANRNYTLGAYPEMSVRDIWFGQQADAFRTLIKNNDLSQGCQSCREQLYASNFTGAMSTSFDRYKLNANGFPSLIQFELSNTCNLECQMCNGDFSSLIRARREKLPPLKAAYDMQFVEQLNEFIPHLEETSFLGGEPFLIDIYYAIWQNLIALNPKAKIRVQTNGTVLNNRVKEILEKGNFHIGVSVDSLQKETFGSIRKNAHFETAAANLLYFNNYSRQRNIEMGIAVTPMQNNWRELPAILRYGNELQAQVYFNNMIFPEELSLKSLPHTQLAEVVDYLSAQTFTANTRLEKNNQSKYNDFLNQVKVWYRDAGGEIEIKPQLRQYYFAKSIADFKEHLCAQIAANKTLSAQQITEQTANISAKLLQLEKAIDYPFAEMRMAKLNLATDLTDIARHIEKMSVDDLVNTSKSPY